MSTRISLVEGELVHQPAIRPGIQWVVVKPAEGVSEDALATFLIRDTRVRTYRRRANGTYEVKFYRQLTENDLKQFLEVANCVKVAC